MIRLRVATLFVALIAAASWSGTAHGASDAPRRGVTFSVNSTADQVDARPGDGHCRTAAGTCTLRAAVMEAARHRGAVVTIVLPAGRFVFTRAPQLGFLDQSAKGALYNNGTMIIRGAGARRTVIDPNRLDRAFFNNIGAHLTMSDLTITNGLFKLTTLQPGAVGGGAIGNSGTLVLHRVTLTRNEAPTGGAVMNAQLGRDPLAFPRSYLEMHDSTVSHNTATWGAGGLRLDGAARIVNSTIIGNRVLESCCAFSYDGGLFGEGGGVDARGEGQVDIINSTITRNHAVIGGGGVNMTNGYFGKVAAGLLPGPLTLRNTIVVGNTSTRGPANCKHVGATIHSRGHNILGDATCEPSHPSDQKRQHAGLGTFGNHGGPTDTVALLRGSPAIGKGTSTDCPAHDQRGARRSARCDIGSFQVAR